MTKQIRIGIVEDHPLYLELLKTGLSIQPGLTVVFSVASAADARKAFSNIDVDALVLDVALPDGNGFGLADSFRRLKPELGIVFLSNYSYHRSLPESALKCSYVLKSHVPSLDYLATVIRLTAWGESIIDAGSTNTASNEPNLRTILTPRQFQVLELVAQGKSNNDIGREIGISGSSVINHLTDIYKALGIPAQANSRVAAVLAYFDFVNDES